MTDPRSDRQTLGRRHFLRGAASLAGLAFLTACGAAATATPPRAAQSSAAGAAGAPSAAAAASAPASGASVRGTTVTWMSNQRHDKAVKEQLFKEMEAKIGVKVDFQVFADEYKDQLKLAFESGKAPDIYNMNAPRLEVEAGWPEPLDEYLAKTPGLKESFLPGAFVPNRGVWGGKTYGLPMYAQTMRLYYNKTIFQKAGLDPNKPPATYAEMRDAAKKITDSQKKDGIYGFILGDKFTWVWWMNAVCLANGAGNYNYDWKAGQYSYNNPGLKEALQLMVNMQQDGSIFPGIHTLTDDDARQQFSLGKAGMIIGGSWNPGVFNDQFSSKEDWETAELPQPSGGLKGRIQQGIGDRYTVSAKSAKKDAGWEVLKYVYSLESMTSMYEKGMGVMGVSKANTGKSSVRGVPKLAPTERDLIIPPAPELPTITPDDNTVMQGIWDDKGATMDQKLAEIEKAYNDTFAKTVSEGKLKKEDFVIGDFDPLAWKPK
jgi:multiple sugar transport system substrate-binding protein